jgi:hypothetical protein
MTVTYFCTELTTALKSFIVKALKDLAIFAKRSSPLYALLPSKLERFTTLHIFIYYSKWVRPGAYPLLVYTLELLRLES